MRPAFPAVMLAAFLMASAAFSGTSAWAAGPFAGQESGRASQKPPGALKDPPLPVSGNEIAKNSGDPVQFLYPQEINVRAHVSTEVDLHFLVANGLHINSHVPREKTLVPTRLAVVEGNGVEVTKVDFPPGTDYALALAPQDKLSVYSGEFVLHARLVARSGDHTLMGELRYQACDRNSCMPPQSLPLAIRVTAK